MNKLFKDLGLKKGSKGTDELRQVIQTVLADDRQRLQLLKAEGQDAQTWLDSLQAVSELPGIASHQRSSIFKIMLRLSKRSGCCPECLAIENVKKLGQGPVSGGRFGDVWRGKVEEQMVCLKVIRSFQVSDPQEVQREVSREAILWKQLELHPNILPFLGMYSWNLDGKSDRLCLVSPWMEHGNLVTFLENSFGEDIDRFTLAHDVASGLAYLHSLKFVHGDIKGLNVLIRAEDKRACIGDFGVARIADNQAISLSASQSGLSGTMRYIAPELLEFPAPRSSTQSDVYAFGGVCYEMFTGKSPFHEMKHDTEVMFATRNGARPTRPLIMMNDNVWDLMNDCWKREPQSRPTATQLCERIRELKIRETGQDVRPAPQWDILTFKKNVERPTPISKLVKRATRLHNRLIGELEIDDEIRKTEELVKLKVCFQKEKPFEMSVFRSVIYDELALEIYRQLPALKDDCDPNSIVIRGEDDMIPGRYLTLVTDDDVWSALRRRNSDGVVMLYISRC